jgi:secreted trypsin-like serine protease
MGKNHRIIGGENTEIEEFPFMASFRYKISNIIFCAGSIISDQHIITVAHCLYTEPSNYNHIRIFTGVSLAKSLLGGIHKIKRIFFHSGFTGEKLQSGVNVNDIAIVKV